MIAWGAETLVAMSALALVVLAMRGPVAHHCGADWAYALWLLPLLRLLLPPLVPIDSGLPLAPLVVTLNGAGEATASMSPLQQALWTPILLALWAGGAAIFLLWQALSYRAFLRRVLANARPGYPATVAGFPILESRACDGPLAVGLLDARILVPLDFLSRYSAAEQRLALHHEAVHHRRGDLWWNLVALGLLALHWWNPVAWTAFRAFRADQELSCDARVLREHPETLRHAYGQALVKSASRPGLIAACPLNSADQLKGRLKMMKSHRVSTLRSLAGGLVLAGAFATGLCLSAPTLAQDAQDGPVKERKIIIREFGKGPNSAELPDEVRERIRDCPEAQKAESDVTTGEGKDKQRTRVVICTKDGKAASAETRRKLAEAIERARGEIRDDDKLSPDQRAKVLEALRREVDRIRSEGQ